MNDIDDITKSLSFFWKYKYLLFQQSVIIEIVNVRENMILTRIFLLKGGCIMCLWKIGKVLLLFI